MSLSNEVYTDIELLGIIERAIKHSSDGLASSEDIAIELGYQPEPGRSLASRVASRLSWNRRLKQIERVDPKSVGRDGTKALWRFTELGEALLRGELDAGAEEWLASANLGSRVQITRVLGETGYLNASSPEAAAVRRQFAHYTSRRRAAGRH